VSVYDRARHYRVKSLVTTISFFLLLDGNNTLSEMRSSILTRLFFCLFVFLFIEFLDLSRMSLSGSLGDDICSIEFDILRADCADVSRNNTISNNAQFVCECCHLCEKV
jgi:hypothetical protein